MNPCKQCVVQVELFKHGEGCSTKLGVLRFFDHRGIITRYAKEHERLSEEQEEHMKNLPDVNVVGEEVFEECLRALPLEKTHRLLTRNKSYLHASVRETIDQSIVNNRPLALETSRVLFRNVDRSEFPQVRDMIGGANNLWVFVFDAHETLLFDECQSLIPVY
jgi:hypothetical protein